MVWDSLSYIATNLSMSIEHIILIIFLVATFVIYGKSFKLGNIFLFITTGLLAMWYYYMLWDWSYALTVCFFAFVVMVLSLYADSRISNEGGFI